MEDQEDDDEESVYATGLQHKWRVRFKAAAKGKKKEEKTPV